MSVAIYSRNPMTMSEFIMLIDCVGWQEFRPAWYEGESSRFFESPDEGSIEAWPNGGHIEATVRHAVFFENLFITPDENGWQEYLNSRLGA